MPVSVAAEEQRIRSLFERVEVIEEVAGTLPLDDDRRARLLAVARDALAEEGTVRPVIAAKILGLSEKTVRAWASAGLLSARQKSPRLLLDVPSVHEVSHILRSLRADGLDRELLEHVWHRLEDQALLDRADLRESIGQLRRGEFVILRAGSGPDQK
jgi:DNA-binding transcriptional MerR regulator